MDKPEWLLKIESMMPNEDIDRELVAEEGVAVSQEELDGMRCPNCNSAGFMFDTGLFWLVDDVPSKDDEIIKCAYCWQNYTYKYLKKVNQDGLSLR